MPQTTEVQNLVDNILSIIKPENLLFRVNQEDLELYFPKEIQIRPQQDIMVENPSFSFDPIQWIVEELEAQIDEKDLADIDIRNLLFQSYPYFNLLNLSPKSTLARLGLDFYITLSDQLRLHIMNYGPNTFLFPSKTKIPIGRVYMPGVNAEETKILKVRRVAILPPHSGTINVSELVRTPRKEVLNKFAPDLEWVSPSRLFFNTNNFILGETEPIVVPATEYWLVFGSLPQRGFHGPSRIIDPGFSGKILLEMESPYDKNDISLVGVTIFRRE